MTAADRGEVMHFIPTKVGPTTLERVITGLYKHRFRAIAIFLLILGADVLVTSLLPRKYESRMKVLVRNDRQQLVVSAGNNIIGGSGEITENEVNSEIELLKSYDILTGVVSALHLDAVGRANGTDRSGPGSTRFETAVHKLDRDLSVAPVRKSAVIQVTYASTSPEMAQAVLKKLAELYLDAHLRVHGSAGTEPFFHQQALRYENDMRQAEDRLNRFNRENDIISLDTQKEVILRKTADFEADLRQTEAARAEARTRHQELRTGVAALPKRVVTQNRVMPNQYSVERLNTMLAELRNKRTLAMMKFRPEDRVVQEIDEEIANTTAAAERSSKLSAVEESTDRNPLRSELESEMAKSELQDSGLKAKVDSLNVALKAFHGRLSALDSAALAHENLVRARTQAEQSYLLYTHKEEEARIAGALDRQKIANVVVTEAPRAEHIPASPHVALNLALGLLFATFASVGMAVAGELNRPSFSGPGELEAATGIVVLGAVPVGMKRIGN